MSFYVGLVYLFNRVLKTGLASEGLQVVCYGSIDYRQTFFLLVAIGGKWL